MAKVSSEIELRVDSSDVNQAKEKVDKLASAAKLSQDALLGMGAAITGLSLVHITNMVKASLEAGDAIAELSAKLNISAEALQKMQYLGVKLNTSTEGITSAFTQLSETIGLADAGYAKAQKSIGFLDETTRSLISSGANNVEIMISSLNYLSKIEDANIRGAIATKLMGEAGKDMATAAHDAGGMTDELINSLNHLPLLTQEQADAASKLNDEWDQMGAALQTSVIKAFLQLRPEIESTIASIGYLSDNIVPLIEVSEKLGIVIAGIFGAKTITNIATWVGSLSLVTTEIIKNTEAVATNDLATSTSHTKIKIRLTEEFELRLRNFALTQRNIAAQLEGDEIALASLKARTGAEMGAMLSAEKAAQAQALLKAQTAEQTAALIAQTAAHESGAIAANTFAASLANVGKVAAITNSALVALVGWEVGTFIGKFDSISDVVEAAIGKWEKRIENLRYGWELFNTDLFDTKAQDAATAYHEQRIQSIDEVTSSLISQSKEVDANTKSLNDNKKASEAVVFAFREAIAAAESAGGTNTATTTNKDGSTNVGKYQQQQGFVDQFYPKGDVKNLYDQEKALENFRQTAEKTYGGDMIKVFAAYQKGMGWVETATLAAKDAHIKFNDQLATVVIRPATDKAPAFTLKDDVLQRVQNYQKLMEVQRTASNAELKSITDVEGESQKKDALIKKLAGEQFTAEQNASHRLMKLKENITTDLVKKELRKRDTELTIIDEIEKTEKLSGLEMTKLSAQHEQERFDIHRKTLQEISKINETANKQTLEEQKKEIAAWKTIEKDKVEIETKLAKLSADTQKLIAQAENQKLKQVQLNNKAEIVSITERYAVELRDARLTAAQRLKIEKDLQLSLAAQYQIGAQNEARAGDTYFNSLKQKISDTNSTSSELNAQMADRTITAFNDMGDALVDFTLTGKASFKDFAISIISDIEKMIVKMLIMKAVQSAIGFAGGGMSGATQYSSSTGLGQWGPNYGKADGGAFDQGIELFADGGIVNSPTMFNSSRGIGVAGEAGPEAIMPLSRGSDGKLGVKSTGGGDNSINIQSVNVTVQSKSNDPKQDGQDSAKAMIAQMRNIARTEIVNSRRAGNISNPYHS